MEGIKISVEDLDSKNGISVVRVQGYIDTTTSSELERTIELLLRQKRYKIIIDLGGVDYISSAGWGIYISNIKEIRSNGGDIKLARMVPDVYEVYELLEFHHIFSAFDTVEEAKEDFLKALVAPQVAQVQSAPLAEAEKAVAPLEDVSKVEEIAEVEAAKMEAMAKIETPVEPGEVTKKIATPEVVDISKLDSRSKILMIVRDHPRYGAWRIKKELNTSKYGFTIMGWFQVRRTLRDFNLNSKRKRLKFAVTEDKATLSL